MTKEHDLQNEIRLHVSREQLGTLFRANVGQGWAGKVQRMHLTPNTNTILLVNPRPFSTGLPVGFPDLFGFVPVTIMPDMVGQEIAVFAAVEVKQKTGRVSAAQAREKKSAFGTRGRACRAHTARWRQPGRAARPRAA